MMPHLRDLCCLEFPIFNQVDSLEIPLFAEVGWASVSNIVRNRNEDPPVRYAIPEHQKKTNAMKQCGKLFLL